MSNIIALITIILVCCNTETARADVNWGASPCTLIIPENTTKESLLTFTGAPAGTEGFTIKSQNVSDRFAISSDGVLSSAKELDYESVEKAYSLTITATTTDSKANEDLTCEIQVTNVNDEHPQFAKDSYSVNILNNVAKDTTLLTVSATDRDVSDAFSKILYSFKDGGDKATFAITSDTGVISAANNLTGPREFTITVVATDNGNNAFTDEASVSICIVNCTSGSPALRNGVKAQSVSALEINIFAFIVLVFDVVFI